MAKGITLTKEKNDVIQVKFGKDLPGLSRLKNGEELPVEYLHAILNYHIANQDASGNLDKRHVDRITPHW